MGGAGEQIVLNLLPGVSDKGTKGEFVGKTDFFFFQFSLADPQQWKVVFGRCGGGVLV